jgi:hypothetical protein
VKVKSHALSSDEMEKSDCLPSNDILISAGSATRLFATVTFANPLVPSGPVAEKLSFQFAVSKDSIDMVEFDSTEKTYWSL